MSRPSRCPICYSQYPDIHMLVYGTGGIGGTRCEDDWHRGPDYDPSKLNLTDDDKVWLKIHHISAI